MDGIGNWDDTETDSRDELESVDNSVIGRVVTWVQTSDLDYENTIISTFVDNHERRHCYITSENGGTIRPENWKMDWLRCGGTCLACMV